MLVMRIELLNGRYDAASWTDSNRPEWPPHPARAFCGLVASAKSENEWTALRWLERQPPPEVWASAEHASVRRSGYLVTNRREDQGRSQSHPGRSNLLSGRSSAQPTTSRIDFVWRVDPVDREIVDTLSGLARRLPYLGRSTGTVLAEFDDAPFEPESNQSGFVPGPLREGTALRVPYEGYVDLLRAQYDVDRPAWEVGREIGYVSADAPEDEPPPLAASPFPNLLVFQFSGIRPVGGLCALFTTSLRRAVMSIVPEPLPPALHGHEPGTPHVAFLALPNVGSERSNGDLLGLAIALPHLAAAQRNQILRALPLSDSSGLDLTVQGIGQVALSYGSGPAFGSTVERWAAASTLWTTATSMVLDRHPKQSRGETVESFVADSCVRAGLPRPVDVVVSRIPLIPGAVTPSSTDLPDWLRKRRMRHVQLRFDTPVRGPVVVGSGRYLGLGLFAPEVSK